jgi:hypothetical protein
MKNNKKLENVLGVVHCSNLASPMTVIITYSFVLYLLTLQPRV